MRRTAAAVLALFLAGCGSPAATKSARLGQPFDLGVGETALLEGEDLRVTFETVSEDSRCPSGAQCIWEGDAVARVTVSRDAQAPATLELHTSGRFERSAPYLTYRIALVDVVPYPHLGGMIDRAGYVATLRVDGP